jgi:hypothetical protein
MTRQWRLIQDATDPVVRRQRGARITIAVAILLDVVFGLMYSRFEHLTWIRGLYWAEEEATTVGTGFEPSTGPGEIIKAAVGITVVPLFAATFSIFTTALTATHVHRAEHSITTKLARHETAIKTHIENHIGGKSGG